jgi:hypothetical protein
VGDIAAAIFSAYILRSGMDWRWCIVVPAVINGVWGFANLLSVPNRPEEAGYVSVPLLYVVHWLARASHLTLLFVFLSDLFRPQISRIITEASVRNDKAAAQQQAAGQAREAPKEAEAIGFFQAFMLPNVMSYAIAFGFFKLVSVVALCGCDFL